MYLVGLYFKLCFPIHTYTSIFNVFEEYFQIYPSRPTNGHLELSS